MNIIKVIYIHYTGLKELNKWCGWLINWLIRSIYFLDDSPLIIFPIINSEKVLILLKPTLYLFNHPAFITIPFFSTN